MPKPTDLTPTERLIIEVLRNQPGMTIEQLLERTGMRWRSNLMQRLRYLSASGLIISDAGGEYSVC